MKPGKAKYIIIAGIAAFIGIIAIQVYWLKRAFDEEEKKFSQVVQVSLLQVAEEINQYYGYKTPHINPVERISDDYYVVNIRNDFDARVLEMLLKKAFHARSINSNFEYAIYDCETDEMLYGSYVQVESQKPDEPATYFPKVKNLVYYFAVRFPGKAGFLFQSLNEWIIVCVVMVMILIIYLYALYIILQQQRYARLQREFINNMTHEFKTPLASILIAAEYLSGTDGNKDQDKLVQYSRIIREQGKKLDDHVSKILNHSRQEADPLILEKQKIDIAASIRQCIDIIQLKYPEARITLNNSLQDGYILADPFHFSNIMYNFLDNSIKYCDQVPEIRIDLEQQGKSVLLRVTDNGIGIEQKHLKQIFDKFYRVPAGKRKQVNGFGLGLFYVSKICRLHGWKLQAESTPGKGSSMTVLIR